MEEVRCVDNNHCESKAVDVQLEMKHADSNNSIPLPPPPIPPVASLESDELPDPEDDAAKSNVIYEDQTQEVADTMTTSLMGASTQLDCEVVQENTADFVVDEKKEVRGKTCFDCMLQCLSYVPCGSFIAWILLLLGLGVLSGSLVVGTRKTRVLLQDDRLLWFVELAVIGVAVSMLVVGTCFFIVCHISTDHTSRRLFTSTSKNKCARGLNTFILVFIYILTLCWIMTSVAITTPIVLLALMFCVSGKFDHTDCLDLKHYGFPVREICSPQLTVFKEDIFNSLRCLLFMWTFILDNNITAHTSIHAQDVLICFSVSLLSSVLVAVSMIHFMICVSANITHLRDSRFATLSAYDDVDQLRNSHHSAIDTIM